VSAPKLTTTRQLLRVWLDGMDDPVDLITRPVDHQLFASTRARHGWPSTADDPMGYLMFLAWAAARRTGSIPTDLTWEKFTPAVVDIAELPLDPLGPTLPGPGPG
jgi:hypothetical protein